MSVNLFIQDRCGDHNFDATYITRMAAESALERFRTVLGGYWTDEDVFVPWHRVDFAKIEELDTESVPKESPIYVYGPEDVLSDLNRNS